MKEKVEELIEKQSTISKDIIKKFGQKAFISGQELVETPKEVISVSPKLDIILGGGIPGGSVVTLAGSEKLGKTILSLHIAAQCQKTDRPIFFLDIEGRLKSRDLLGIRGLDPNKVNIIKSYKGKILLAEDYLTIAIDILTNIPRSVVIMDSVSQLCTEKEFNCNMGEQQRAPGAILLAQFCKKIANIVPVNDNIIIMIQHLIANTSGYGASLVASGGRKIKYSMDVGLMGKSFKLLRPGNKDDDENVPPYGQEVVWQTTSTAFVAPGQKTTSIIRFGEGIDTITENIQLAIDFGLIIQSASWLDLVYLGGESQKIQGRENLYQFFNQSENIHLYQKLQEEIRKITVGNV